MTTGPGPMLIGCDCNAGVEVVLAAARALVAPATEFAGPVCLVVVLGNPTNRARTAPMLFLSLAIRVWDSARPAPKMVVKSVCAAPILPAPRSVDAAASALVTVCVMANGAAVMSTPRIATSPIRGKRPAGPVPEFDAATEPVFTPVAGCPGLPQHRTAGSP